MPVLPKKHYAKLRDELDKRVDKLYKTLATRELRSAREGAPKGSWVEPNNFCATLGTQLEISLAIEDFKSILTEIKKLK